MPENRLTRATPTLGETIVMKSMARMTVEVLIATLILMSS
jgi:hypothetical protein